ncbi:bifunctional diguanylate cyclase/phosphodiesterase [Microvirga makkahensis]|uniref:EAL domain-containing protein n=1 Tax=Microvirga makkahensis TaxID=1128670 RepID=A0A7X3MV54_9HYPH|nr:EAL domain-containing protein [Microvirga makkahensis]MXQ13540.1 EAL domain-containing protein [Microvirga makkahensis]
MDNHATTASDLSRDLGLEVDETLYRHAVELSQQIPWTSDGKGRIIHVGPGWTDLLDIPYEELLGSGWIRLVHPDDVARVMETRRKTLSTGESYQCEYRIRVADGSYRWFRARAGAQRDQTGAIARWYGIIEDIQDRKQAELIHQGHTRVLEMIAADRPLHEVLEALCRLAEEQIPAARCSILLLDRERQVLCHGAAPSLPAPYNAAIDGLPVGPGVGSCGTAAAECRNVIVTDIASDPLWADWRDVALFHGLQACWSKPVLTRSGEVLGTFAFYHGERRAPTESEMARIDAVRHLAALAIERQQNEATLRESEEHYRHSVELNPQIPWTADPQGNILDTSSRWYEHTGVPVERALGSGWQSALHPDDVAPAQECWQHSVMSGEPFDTEYRIRLADGSYRWCRARAAARRNQDGAVLRWYGTVEDIHDRKLAKEHLRHAAYHDDLTGLPNRRLFHERLRQTVAEAARSHRMVGLLLIDMDHLKKTNDRFGHDVGDTLLQALGMRLRSAVGATDTVARLGGDEFAILLPEVADETQVATTAKAVMAQMQEPLRHHGSTLEFRISIGATCAAGSGMTAEQLLKQADLALYHGKVRGRGTFTMFNPAMREAAQRTASALEIAGKAVTFGWIEPFYQPKVAPASGALGGFEALLRWRHPRRGIQSPGAIAPAFDDPGLGIAIGERMRIRVFRDIGGWLEAGLDVGRVAINAAAVELRRGDYAERVLEELGWAGVPTSCLEVEVTESVLLDSSADTVERALRTLSAAGVTIALDDFGTGYASLAHLKRFPVDVIKIDRSFVSKLETDAGDAAIVRAVLGLGQSLGIKVVAEGVETAAQMTLLREQGCALVQGYHVGRPMPAQDVPQFIAARAKTWSSDSK